MYLGVHYTTLIHPHNYITFSIYYLNSYSGLVETSCFILNLTNINFRITVPYTPFKLSVRPADHNYRYQFNNSMHFFFYFIFVSLRIFRDCPNICGTLKCNESSLVDPICLSLCRLLLTVLQIDRIIEKI